MRSRCRRSASRSNSIPGRINETWFRATREGIYYGQCSELCGKDHAYMPIAVRVVSEEQFKTWVEGARKKFARDDVAPATTVARRSNRPPAERRPAVSASGSEQAR